MYWPGAAASAVRPRQCMFSAEAIKKVIFSMALGPKAPLAPLGTIMGFLVSLEALGSQEDGLLRPEREILR